MFGKECLDASRAGLPQSGDNSPPTAPTRYTDSQICQGVDASGSQRGDSARIQPQRHVIADGRFWQRQRAEQLDRLVGCSALFGAFACCNLKLHRQIFALPSACERGELAPDATEHAARGLPRSLALA